MTLKSVCRLYIFNYILKLSDLFINELLNSLFFFLNCCITLQATGKIPWQKNQLTISMKNKTRTKPQLKLSDNADDAVSSLKWPFITCLSTFVQPVNHYDWVLTNILRFESILIQKIAIQFQFDSFGYGSSTVHGKFSQGIKSQLLL